MILVPALLTAQTQSCQTELNGFLLGQYTSALKSLGKPDKMGEQNGWKYQAYKFPKNSYMVFEVDPQHPEQIAAIQVTGENAGMRSFAGVKLGDTQEQLVAKLGKPDQVTPEPEEELQLLEYRNQNYTIEVSKDKRVYSIHIAGYVKTSQPSHWLLTANPCSRNYEMRCCNATLIV
jgi:hypothetical protein